MKLESLAPAVLDLVFPRACAGCGKSAKKDSLHFCWDCLSGFEYITDKYCSLCGDPIEGVVHHAFTCAACTDRKPYFDMARSAARFRGPLKDALHMFKYEHATHLSGDFVPLLAGCVNAHYQKISFDSVAYVPLHHRKERERTYNQAELLARGLAASLKVPILHGCLLRTRGTDSQTTLSASQRRKNIHGAFSAAKERWLDGRTVLLVDDVMTTGATVDEASKVLKKAGAYRVCVVTVARG